METEQQQSLNWQGYSSRNKVTLDSYAHKLVLPLALYKNIPLCYQSVAAFLELPENERLRREAQLLKSLDDSAMMIPYAGFMPASKLNWLRKQLELYTRSVLFLAKTIAQGEEEYLEEKLLHRLHPEVARDLKSAVNTSKLNYAQCENGSKLFANLERFPLYAELGVDFMSSRDELVLAEFQVRYTSPYPHLLTKFLDSYRVVLPELCDRLHPHPETFESKRNALIERTHELLTKLQGKPPDKLVIDAWAYLENSGANWKALADSLGMDYSLFDDFYRDQNLIARKYRKSNVMIFNQPALHLLDPDEPTFQPINSEGLEDYPELQWAGLMRKYQEGSAYLLNPPVTDIVNDKALYGFLPAIAAAIYGETLELPVIDSIPAWSADDPSKPDQAAFDLVRKEQANFVVTHRYLEGGLGIKIGAKESAEEFNSFLQTFVADRPYLYVFRRYFKMEPDVSLRLLIASLSNTGLPEDEPEITISDTMFGRFSHTSPIRSETAWCFGIFGTDKDLESA